MQRAVPGVLIGGVAGSVLRWAVAEIGWSTSVTLVVVNTLGCAVLGGVVARWPAADHPVRLAAGLGFCGGLTTFSTLAVRVAQHLDAEAFADATRVSLGNVGLGLAAFVTVRAGMRR